MKYLLSLTAVFMLMTATAATEYRFRHYTDADGLSSNTIQSIYQDSRGYMWIGTANGLDRFDSNNFFNFRARSDCGRQFENDCVYALCGENTAGHERIWVGTNDGIFIFDTFDSGFERFPLMGGDGEYRNLVVYALVADASDCMWIATLGAGVFRYDPASGRTEHFDSRSHPEAFPSDAVTSLLLDNGNHVWLACEQTVSRYNPENDTFSTFRVEDSRQRLAISRVSRMCLDSFGNIWIGGYESEMFKFEVQQLAFTANSPARSFGRIRSLIEHTPGVMLLGTDSGLVDFYVENREYRHLDDGTSGRNGRLTDKFVHSILKDRDGGIWIGTYFGGINYLSPCGMLFSSLEGGEGCGHVISKFCEDSDGNIWIGSDDGGLSLYDPRSGRYEKMEIDSAAAALNIHALMVDDGALWIGTYGSGLYRMNLRTRHVRRFTAEGEGLENLDVYSLHRDAAHRLWIGTKAGICLYDDGSDSISCACPLEYSSDVVDICEDPEGNVWFATMGNGLIRYEYGSHGFCRFPIDGNRSDYVSCLAMGATKLWIGTQGSGLYRYDIAEGDIEHEFADTGYADCSVFQIVQNGDELWLTTNHGLLQYNYGRRQMPIVYTSDDGLLASIFNFNSGIKSLSGHIYIGSNNGVNRFYPYDFVGPNRTAAPDVVFGDIKFFGRSVHSDDSVQSAECRNRVDIRSSRVSFSLDFIALNYSSPLRTVYRYRLKGIDQMWITTGANYRSGPQRIFYSNLRPGKYRFTVSASVDGEHFGRESSVDIVVTAPWWMSDVMRTVYFALLLFAAIAAILHWRRRAVIERDRKLVAEASKNDCDAMRAKIALAVDSKNEICEPLSLISAMAAELSERSGLPVALQDEFGRIHRNCEALSSHVGRMFDILDSDGTWLSKSHNAAQNTSEGLKDSPPLAWRGESWPDDDGTVAGRVSVLFVDSNEEYLNFWMRNLSQTFAVHGAAGGSQALQILHAHRFSAVVCGMMPNDDMDGIALGKTIKSDESYDDIPVILLSSDVSKQLKMRALLAGVDVCLPKEVAMDYLSLQIHTLVDEQNRMRFKYSRNPYLRSGADDDTLRINNFMERLNRYVGDHISDTDMTVDDIAAALRVSRTQLFQRIREIAGTTPNELVRSMRLKRAAELMASRNDLRVSEISYMVGFTSASYFSKCFRSQFGVLPNQYIEHCRNNTD